MKFRHIVSKRYTVCYYPFQIPTLNLLESDRSTLNVDQWILLSNLVHCFNEYSGYTFVERCIEQQNVSPLKLRFKYSSVCDFITMIKTNVQLVFKKNRDFLSLSQDDHIALLRGTVEYTTSLGGMFRLRHYKLYDYVPFYKSAEMGFQPSDVALSKLVMDGLDIDDTFIKLILAILVFSTTTCT
ncbi:unnamed protein product [Rotaria magnacalcarata]|uniref:Uncharacterized protein n=1 Tax=Rotaria magnacalcarata TaxID=392030 RepID=A0A814RDM2_9BILA|nr:unnamed protein product [Rotaria magnacalcarata]CAF1630726.1 unnamed protein product [Rotaria magnacalcarata]CAF2093023.1 unnamed protein product [Rotaria magnacalcarata]CAF3885698.1 unnamed protein product [Rotaria magnacalcarata]CAF3911262.1 unnamed protein product [Rotaria magnacalcarata]